MRNYYYFNIKNNNENLFLKIILVILVCQLVASNAKRKKNRKKRKQKFLIDLQLLFFDSPVETKNNTYTTAPVRKGNKLFVKIFVVVVDFVVISQKKKFKTNMITCRKNY